MFRINLFRSLTLSILLIAALVLSGCQPGEGADAPAIAQTPSTTPDVLGYTTGQSPACLLADWSGMQTNKLQGDLLAWSSDSARLAYLAPQPSTSWYVGLTAVAEGPRFEQRSILVPNIMAVGDLNWSPDGSQIAFVALRSDESLQTVMVARSDGSSLTDLFPFDQARSDLRTSQKAISGWSDANHLRVITSCEEDCQQEYDINVTTGTSRPDGAAERRNALKTPTPGVIKVLDGLEPVVNLQSYNEKEFPKGLSKPNWSPNKKQVLYLDRRGLLWNLNPSSKSQYLLDIGLRFVDETKWSPDGLKVAVRAEDRIFVFELTCSPSPLP